MNRLILAAAIAGVAATGAAIAQSVLPPGKLERGLLSADTNGDGIISRSEALAAADKRFTARDANRDGKLSGGELRGPNGRGIAADGTITRDEMRTRALARFDRADINHDGGIDATERQAMRGRRGRGAAAMLAMADANRDGAVTRAEATTAAQKLFDRVDANHDGQIDQAERQAMRERFGRRARLDTTP